MKKGSVPSKNAPTRWATMFAKASSISDALLALRIRSRSPSTTAAPCNSLVSRALKLGLLGLRRNAISAAVGINSCISCSAALPQERAGGRAFRCAPCGLLVGERSVPVERLRKLEHALGRRIPAFRRIRVVVQIAAHAHEPRAFREGEVPAHRWTGHVGVEFRQLRAVDEIDAPFALHMRAAVEHVVGMGMGVAANPNVDHAGMRREIILERLRFRLVAEEV